MQFYVYILAGGGALEYEKFYVLQANVDYALEQKWTRVLLGEIPQDPKAPKETKPTVR